MKIKLTVYQKGGKSFIGDDKALSVIKHTKKRLFAVCADFSLTDGYLQADKGLVCDLSDIPQGRFVCDYMISNYWSAPFFGTDYSLVPKSTQAMLTECGKGYFGILPVMGRKYRTYLVGTDRGLTSVSYSMADDLNSCKDPLFIYGYGDDPYALIKDLYRYAIIIMGRNVRMREDRKYPEKLEYLGWCSWDAFHIRVSEQGVEEKCREFKEKKVPVRWMMLDDMWADCPRLNDIPEGITFWDMIKEMYQTSMRSFAADKSRFPNGLKGCVDKVASYGFETAVWFPTTGYWHGFDLEGEEVKKSPESFITNKNGYTIIRPVKDHFKKIYAGFAEHIKDCGGSFIKVDRQSCLSMYSGLDVSLGECAEALQSTVEEVACKYFNGNIIHCMGMSSENMWNREVTAVIRCSDDFMPDDEAWFKKHINHCAYNTLFWGNLYYTDWDMFWTNDKQALKNTVLHALSGGPVYISDKIGETNPSILKGLCREDGKLIRAEDCLVPVLECLFSDASKEGTAIALFNRKNGAVALTAFHICEAGRAVQKIALSQFGFESNEVCVYDWFNKTAKIYNTDEVLKIELKSPDEIGLYILCEVKNGFAVVGDSKKFLPTYCIESIGSNEIVFQGDECTIVSNKILQIEGAEKVKKEGICYVCIGNNKSKITVTEIKALDGMRK